MYAIQSVSMDLHVVDLDLFVCKIFSIKFRSRLQVDTFYEFKKTNYGCSINQNLRKCGLLPFWFMKKKSQQKHVLHKHRKWTWLVYFSSFREICVCAPAYDRSLGRFGGTVVRSAVRNFDFHPETDWIIGVNNPQQDYKRGAQQPAWWCMTAAWGITRRMSTWSRKTTGTERGFSTQHGNVNRKRSDCSNSFGQNICNWSKSKDSRA